MKSILLYILAILLMLTAFGTVCYAASMGVAGTFTLTQVLSGLLLAWLQVRAANLLVGLA